MGFVANHEFDRRDYTRDSQIWSEFYKKPIAVRLEILKSFCRDIDFSWDEALNKGLTNEIADLMIENCIGVTGLPLAIVPYMVINKKRVVIPMAVEEASVVAACCNISKLIAANGGFSGRSSENIMTGQITIYDISIFKNSDAIDNNKMSQVIEKVTSNRAVLIQKANSFCSSMVKRGGGVIDLSAHFSFSTSSPYLLVQLQINVCESMGANIVNTVCEKIAPEIVKITGGRTGMKILSNLCLERMSSVAFQIPLDRFGWKGIPGHEVAKRVMEAHSFAKDNVSRAVTNNKGVMNGIDAVAVATGQDWRAIESAAHAFAALKNSDSPYSPLVDYRLVNHSETERFLEGELTLPIAVGVVGGATQTHPSYKTALGLMGNPSAKDLAQAILAAGVCNNLAAMRALAVEGIQKSHMKLHAKNIALSAGASLSDVDHVVNAMISSGRFSAAAAKQIMAQRKEDKNGEEEEKDD